jgi:hypothetical protein
VKNGAMHVAIGYVAGQPPASRAFRGALDDELQRLRTFLGAT